MEHWRKETFMLTAYTCILVKSDYDSKLIKRNDRLISDKIATDFHFLFKKQDSIFTN